VTKPALGLAQAKRGWLRLLGVVSATPILALGHPQGPWRWFGVAPRLGVTFGHPQTGLGATPIGQNWGVYIYIHLFIWKMTRDRSSMSIFWQNETFWNFLVVWRARVQWLVVWGATFKTAGSLEGLKCNSPFLLLELYRCNTKIVIAKFEVILMYLVW
jgi:hypothetical protein